MDAVLLKKLEVRRFGEKKKGPRGSKVPAGQSYSSHTQGEDTAEEVESEDDEVEEESEEDEVEEEDEALSEGHEDPDDIPELPDLPNKLPDRGAAEGDGDAGTSWNHSLVVAVYKGQWFVAEICKEQNHIPKGYKRVSYSTIKGKNAFMWPSKKDIVLTLEEDIILKNVTVESLNSRGHFALKKIDEKKVNTLMVVVYLSKTAIHYIILS